MKKLCIILALLCLAGCTPAAPPSESTPAIQSADLALYAYENGARHLAVDQNGTVVIEVCDGQLSILKQDDRTAGICVMRTEGSTTDEWGWKSPETYRNDIYDVTGNFRFSVPLSYVTLEGDFLSGYNPKAGSIQIYRFSDGKLLYDKVETNFPLGDSFFVQSDSGKQILHKDGSMTTVPEEYNVYYNISDDWMIVEKDGLQGLMNSRGEEVLPCHYVYLAKSEHGYVYVQTEEDDHAVIDPATGSVMFHWPYSISSMPTKDCVVVATDDDYGSYQLVDSAGNPILDQTFAWIGSYSFSEGSEPVLHATSDDPQSSTLFRPDGTVLYTASGYGYCNVIDEKTVLICQYGDGSTDWLLMDPETGSKTELPNSSDSYYSQIFGTEGGEPYLLRGYTNEQGWYRHDILDANGNVLLSDLQDCVYLGDGIIQCQKGFRSGLMRLDGTWLYEESTFSSMDDD